MHACTQRLSTSLLHAATLQWAHLTALRLHVSPQAAELSAVPPDGVYAERAFAVTATKSGAEDGDGDGDGDGVGGG
eukprot:1112809-Pleurochrysis_carterae.AAC.1